MRIISIISLIAAFALATVVCADTNTSKSLVPEATSLQSRRLNGEVHVVRIRRPVDGSIISDDESTSAEAVASASGDPSPPIRKRKHIPEDVEYASGILVNLKNAGNGADTASSPGTRPNRQKHKDQLNLNRNDDNPEETADVPSAPRKTFKKSTEKERQDMVLFLRHRMKGDGSLPFGTINLAAEHFGRHRTTISRIYTELKPNSADERGTTEQERQDIVSFLRQRMNAEGKVPYGTNIQAAKHFGRHENTISRIYNELKPKSLT
jgi:DNA-binding transcriptional regulator YhcF (GntR family)